MPYQILLYTDDPGVGGVAQYNHAVLCALAGNGYRVACAQSRTDNPLVQQQAVLGVRHIWLNHDTTADLGPALNDPSTARIIFEKVRPDLVLFSNCCPISNLAAKRQALLQGLPCVIIEGFADPSLAETFAPYLLELGPHYAAARAVIAVSQDNLRLLREQFHLPPGKGQVIHYGRPARYFHPSDPRKRARFRAEEGIPADGILCFTAARLEYLKGYQYLLEAIRLLRGTDVWSRLWFAWAGTGSLSAPLTEALQQSGFDSRVRLLGQRWDIEHWLDAADIFLLPSRAEGMPLAIMEAMARGLPVAASAVSGIPEQLGPTGQLLPSPCTDPETTIHSLCETITTWVKDESLRRSVGASCRERARTLFREERMLEQTLRVIERGLLPRGDYVSPELEVIRPDACFPHLRIGDRSGHPWPHLRHEVPHNWYVDARWPTVGFLNRDEAHLLYHNARQFRGHRALEIGCFLGWSTCHLGLAGLQVDVIDPLLAQPEIAGSVHQALDAAGVRRLVHLSAGSSPFQVEELAQRGQGGWSFFFIDGNHEGNAPYEDARVCARCAAPEAMILFHDLAAPAVARGLDYLRDQGWETLVYQTSQIMGAAWRGRRRPIAHQPDPCVEWHLPEHLRGYAVSSQPSASPGAAESG